LKTPLDTGRAKFSSQRTKVLQTKGRRNELQIADDTAKSLKDSNFIIPLRRADFMRHKSSRANHPSQALGFKLPLFGAKWNGG
jgi:hypothetical protein